MTLDFELNNTTDSTTGNVTDEDTNNTTMNGSSQYSSNTTNGSHSNTSSPGENNTYTEYDDSYDDEEILEDYGITDEDIKYYIDYYDDHSRNDHFWNYFI